MRAGADVYVLTRADRVFARVNSMRGGTVLATDIPVSGLVVEASVDRDVPERVEFVAPLEFVPDSPYAPLNNYGQRVQVVAVVSAGGVEYETEIGWFVLTDPFEERKEGVRVTGMGLLQVLDDAPLSFPLSPNRGERLWDAVKRLSPFIPSVLEDESDNPVVSVDTQWGVSRSASLRELCAAYGFDYAVRPDGYLHVWRRRTAGSPDAFYSGRDLLVESPRRGVERRPNRWVVVSQKDGKDGHRWVSEASDVAPPYDVAGYGLVVDRRELSDAKTFGDVQAAANRNMRNGVSVASARRFEIVCDPRIEVGDVVSVETLQGETVVGRVRAYSMPISEPGKTMRVDVEVLAW